MEITCVYKVKVPDQCPGFWFWFPYLITIFDYYI